MSEKVGGERMREEEGGREREQEEARVQGVRESSSLCRVNQVGMGSNRQQETDVSEESQNTGPILWGRHGMGRRGDDTVRGRGEKEAH